MPVQFEWFLVLGITKDVIRFQFWFFLGVRGLMEVKETNFAKFYFKVSR